LIEESIQIDELDLGTD